MRTTSTPDFTAGIATETLQCIAGHSWTRPESRGGKPHACPEHARFLTEPLSYRSRAPKRLIELWEETAVIDPPEQYVQRWRKVWERTVRAVAAQRGTFASVDMDMIEDYVQHKRLAELHRAYAEYDPYQTTNAGSVKPHPGWYQSQVEATAARRAAIALGLEPDPSAPQGKGGDWPDEDSQVYDDQLGPDGRPL
jgi:hypothetical protein